MVLADTQHDIRDGFTNALDALYIIEDGFKRFGIVRYYLKEIVVASCDIKAFGNVLAKTDGGFKPFVVLGVVNRNGNESHYILVELFRLYHNRIALYNSACFELSYTFGNGGRGEPDDFGDFRSVDAGVFTQTFHNFKIGIIHFARPLNLTDDIMAHLPQFVKRFTQISEFFFEKAFCHEKNTAKRAEKPRK